MREIGRNDEAGPKIGPGAIRGRWRVDLGSILMVPRVQEVTNVRWMMVTTLGAQLGRIGRRGERYKVDLGPQRRRERCVQVCCAGFTCISKGREIVLYVYFIYKRERIRTFVNITSSWLRHPNASAMGLEIEI